MSVQRIHEYLCANGHIQEYEDNGYSYYKHVVCRHCDAPFVIHNSVNTTNGADIKEFLCYHLDEVAQAKCTCCGLRPPAKYSVPNDEQFKVLLNESKLRISRLDKPSTTEI